MLRALDFGLGSCWVRLIDELKIKELFGWDDNIYVVAGGAGADLEDDREGITGKNNYVVITVNGNKIDKKVFFPNI